MKDIHEVLRQKQTKYAQLGKQIEMLQQAAEKLREVAPLLAENDDEDNAVLTEVDEASDAMAAKAGAAGSGASALQRSSADGASLAIDLAAGLDLAGKFSYDPSGIAGFHRRFRLPRSWAGFCRPAGIAVERFSDLATAVDRLRQQRFDALIVDFEDPKAAAEMFEEARRLNSGNAPVTVALVAEHSQGAGYSERRRAFRPVQTTLRRQS